MPAAARALKLRLLEAEAIRSTQRRPDSSGHASYLTLKPGEATAADREALISALEYAYVPDVLTAEELAERSRLRLRSADGGRTRHRAAAHRTHWGTAERVCHAAGQVS